MYSHVLFKLKAHKFQKLGEQHRVRDGVEKQLNPYFDGDSVIDADTKYINTHQLHTFAVKLKQPIKFLSDLPENFHNTLRTHKDIETFAPSLLILNPQDPQEQPSPEDCMDLFTKWAPQLNIPSYEAFGIKCAAARGEGNRNNHKASQFGEQIRDHIVDYMKEKYPAVLFDRCPEMKAKLTELRVKAEAEAKATNRPYKKAVINQILFQLDLATKVGFWFSETAQGGGAAKTVAEVQETQQKTWNQLPVEEKIGQRVVICKIGEIFLKKGNRGKFLWQLQTNIAFKLSGKAVVKQQQYSFIIVPPQHFKGRPFTSEELKEILSIVKCIPGVDAIQVAMKTQPTEEAMSTTMQYMMALTALENNESCKTKPLKQATIVQPKDEYHDAVIQFLKGKNIPQDKLSTEQQIALQQHQSVDSRDDRVQRRVKRLTKRVEDIFHCGVKVDVSLNPPTFFSSRTGLGRSLQQMTIIETSKLAGLPEGELFMDPGRYQRQLRLERLDKPRDPLASDDEFTVSYDDEDLESTTNMTMNEDDNIVASEEQATTMNDVSTTTKTAAAAATTTFKTTTPKMSNNSSNNSNNNSNNSSGNNSSGSMWVKPSSGLEFQIEVHQTDAYISLKSDSKYTVGGQPTGTGSETNTVVCLLSGGMDSPVAAFSLMKRGMRVILVHFQNANLADEETVQGKIIQLSDHLSKFQISTYLHIVPFSAIQDAIITEVPSPARMLVYRRFMMSISAKIAELYNAQFLVVGDALGQVASQTPKNMYASYANAPLPLLSPLVGSNKNEIMDVARQIGTYDISALPYGDCCSYFLAKHPLTAIEKDLLHQYEDNVGRAIEGGNAQLIADAQNASAIYRWHKPADGMVSLRAMSPVQSYHDNAATNMLMSCPLNQMEDDEESEMHDNNNISLTTTAQKDNSSSKKRKNDESIVQQEQSSADINKNEEEMVLKQTTLADINKKSKANADSPRTVVAKQQHVELDDVDINKIQPAANNNMVAYLDSASTTRVLPTVMNAVQRFTSGQLFGNSSSLHVVGKTADLAVKQATTTILGIINAHDRTEDQQLNVYGIGGDERLIYTSGGTEANNLAIFGSLKHSVQKQIDAIVTSLGHIPVGQKLNSNRSHPTNLSDQHPKKYVFSIHLVSSGLEHSAIIEPLQLVQQSPDQLISNRYGLNISFNVITSYVSNDCFGLINTEHFQRLLTSKPHMNNRHDMAKNSGLDLNSPDTEIIDVATFCSIMHANNEIGIIQPLDKIGKAIEEFKTSTASTSTTLFHTDACQSFGKVNIDVQHCNIDLLTLNGHKLHGVKGVGALYIKPTVKVSALQHGGGHQHGIRSGTLNVSGIVAMQHAATYCYSIPANVEVDAIQQYVKSTYQQTQQTSAHDILTQHGKEIRQKQLSFLYDLKLLFPKAVINGPNAQLLQKYLTNDDFVNPTEKNKTFVEKINDFESDFYTTNNYPSLPSVLSILFDPSSQLDSPGIVKYLSTRGVCVSAGSACASNNSEPKPSHVLKGIGLQDQYSNGTVRLSFSVLTSQKELDNALVVFKGLAADLHSLYKKSGRS